VTCRALLPAKKGPDTFFRSLLFKESAMVDVHPDKLKAKGMSEAEIDHHVKTLRVAVNEVFVLWHNNYRYASEERLLSHLKRMKLYQGVKGDVRKARALQLLNAARLFITKGVLQWH
jgi:hypothetical protein